MSVQHLATQFAPGFDAPLLPDQFSVKAGFYTVKTIAQRNNIKSAYRKLDGFSNTLVFVSDTNRLYKLINEPGTSTTTALDWEEIILGTEGGVEPVGEWDPTTNLPELTDGGALNRNGEFYFVINAGTGFNFIDDELFDGALTEVFNGDWVISVGDKWTILRPTVTWDQITKPQSIIDYVNGTVIAHTHGIADITGLQIAIDEKFDVDDTADHTVDFETVPDADLVEVEFLKAHYYRRSEIDSALSSLGSAITFLSLTDTPSTFETHGSKLVRVNAAANGLEFVAATSIVTWANLSGQPTTLAGYGITDGATTFTNGLTRTGNGVKWGGELADAVTLVTGVEGTKALHLGGDGVVGGINRLAALEVRANYVDMKTSLSITLDSTAGLNLNASGATGQITIDSGPNGPQLLLNSTTATFLDRRLLKKGWEYSGDYSPGYTLRSLIDKNYADTRLMGKLLPASPGAAQTNQALRWNNNADAWEFYVPGSGGGGGGGSFSFQNGITESGGIVRLGGPLTEASTSVVTGHRDFHIQSQAFDYVGGSTWLQIGGADDNNQYAGIGAFLDETQVNFTAFYVSKTLGDVAATFTDGRGVRRGIEYAEPGYESTDLSLMSRGYGNANYWNLNGTSTLLGPIKVITSVNEVAIGQNITASNIGSSYNFLTGLDHALTGGVGVTGSSINWATISGEFNIITVNHSARLINNASIIGGYNNAITLNSGAGNMYSPTILGTQSSIVNTAVGNITGAMVIGYKSHSQADMSMVLGLNSLAKPAAIGGFSKGFVTTYTTNGTWTGTVEPVTVGGRGAINISANSTAQTIGHGAYGNYSAILGGYDHHIPADSHQSVVLGGIGIKARAADPNNVYVPYFNIVSIDQDDALTQILVRNGTTGKIYYANPSYLKANTSTAITGITSFVGSGLIVEFGPGIGLGSGFNVTTDSSIFFQGNGQRVSITGSGGATYNADYKANYTDRSLIDRGFANSNYWKLAGTSAITANATINLADFTLSIDNVLSISDDAITMVLPDKIGDPTLTMGEAFIELKLEGPNPTRFVTLGNQTVIGFRVNSGSPDKSAITFGTPTSGGIKLEDQTNLRGAWYDANYSVNGVATYGDRWIPDKGYNHSNYWKLTGTSTLTAATIIDQASFPIHFTNVDQFLIKGRSTSTIANLLIQDSNGNRLLMFDNAGRFTLGTTTNVRFYSTSDGTSNDVSGPFLAFVNTSTIEGTRYTFGGSGSISLTTSGESEIIRIRLTAAPASGDHNFTALSLAPTYDATGTYSGSVRGLYYNPSITSLVATAKHYAVHTTSGSVLFANSDADTLTASTRLDVRGISGGNILRLANDANVQKMHVTNDGYFIISGTDAFSGGGGFVGNYTATTSTVGHLYIQPNITGSSSTIGTYTIVNLLGGLVAGANTQRLTKLIIGGPYTLGAFTGATLYGIDYNPTITGTPTTHYAIRTASGSILFANSSSDTLTTFTRFDVRGTGTGSGKIMRLANSSNAEKFYVRDSGVFFFDSVLNSQFTHAGTTTINNDYGLLFTGNITARATTSDVINYFRIPTNLIAGANNQTLQVFNIHNSFTNGASTGMTNVGIHYNPSVTGSSTHIAIRTSSGSLFFANSSSDTITASTRVDIRGTGTTTNNILRLADSANATRLTIFDDGRFTYNNVSTFHTPYEFQMNGLPWLRIRTAAPSYGGYTGTGPSVNFGGTSAGFILLQEDGIALADSSGNGWILGIINGNQPANIGQIQINPREGVGNSYAMDVIGGNTAGSGSHTGKTIHMRPKLNYSGGTSTFIGIDYNPTITSVAGLTRHYALKTATGSILFGNAAADLLTANTRLDVRGISSGNIVRFATDGNVEKFRITTSGAIIASLSSAIFSSDFEYSAFTVRVPQLDISTPAASFSATIAGVNEGEYLYKRRAAFGGFLSWPDTDITTYHTADHSTDDTPNGSGVRIPDNVSSLVTVKIVARRTGGTAGSANDSAAYVLRGLFKKVAGTVTQIGSTIKEVVGESQAGWDANLIASAGEVNIMTTSAVDNTVDWNFEIEVMRV